MCNSPAGYSSSTQQLRQFLRHLQCANSAMMVFVIAKKDAFERGLKVLVTAVYQTRKTSLEVAPTTLRLALLIYNFHFKSSFLARCRN